jgi:regulator of replication initiation timing
MVRWLPSLFRARIRNFLRELSDRVHEALKVDLEALRVENRALVAENERLRCSNGEAGEEPHLQGQLNE